MRVPFEIVEEFALELVHKALADLEQYSHYMELYLLYLKECGWTDQSFDEEMLKQVDASWGTEYGNNINYWH